MFQRCSNDKLYTDMNALPTVGDSECVHDAASLDSLKGRICLVHNGLFYYLNTTYNSESERERPC